MKHTITAFDIIPFLFYPFLLAVSSVVFILLGASNQTGHDHE